MVSMTASQLGFQRSKFHHFTLTLSYTLILLYQRATSGCMTVCMQTHLKLSALRSRALFSKQFGIPEEMLKQVGNGDNKFLEDKGCAKLDSKDPLLMNNEGKFGLLIYRYTRIHIIPTPRTNVRNDFLLSFYHRKN